MRRSVGVSVLVLLLSACAVKPLTPDAEGDRPVANSRERARAHTELGVNYYQAGQTAVALEELGIAVKADPGFAPAFNALALVHMDLHQDAAADANFREALRLDPHSADTKNNYGLYLCQRGQGREGLQQMVAAAEDPLYSTPDVAYKNAGVCARKLGDGPAAEDYFQRALRSNPNQSQAIYNLADISFGRRDFKAAAELLSRYFNLVREPGAEELWLAARVEALRGARESAANYGQRLRRGFPDSAQAKAFEAGRFE